MVGSNQELFKKRRDLKFWNSWENEMNITKTSKAGERVALLIIALLGIFDGLVTLCTLTLVDSDYRAHFLFSDFCNRLTGVDH